MAEPEQQQAEPEPSPEQLVQERRAEAERLREQGIDPYPHSFPGVTPVEKIHQAHDSLDAGEETDAQYRVPDPAGALSVLNRLAQLLA